MTSIEIGGSHRPAEALHDPVDGVEIDAVAHELQEGDEIGRQHAVDDEAGAIADDDRRLAHGAGVTNGRRDRALRGLRPAHDLDERHARHRIEEMHADEILGARQPVGKVGDAQ